MNSHNDQLLRYLIDNGDGTLDHRYCRKIMATSFSAEYFQEFHPHANEFRDTPHSLIFDFIHWHWHELGAPPTQDTINAELFIKTPLGTNQKLAVGEALRRIRKQSVNPNEFDYLLDLVRSAFLAAKSVSVIQTGLKEIKADPVAGIRSIQKGLASVSRNADSSFSEEDAKTQTLEQFAGMMLNEFESPGGVGRNLVSYPWSTFNSLLGGMHPGELIVIAGDSNAGKSFLGRSIAYHVGLTLRKLTVCADREMDPKQQGLRFVSYLTGIPSRKLRNPDLQTKAEKELIRETLLAHQSFHKDYNLEETTMIMIPANYCNNANKIRQEIDGMTDQKPKCIVADYLNEFDPSKRSEGWEAMGVITRDLKRLGQHYGCPVVTMAQQAQGGKKVQYKSIREICDTLLLISMSADKPYVPPGEGEYIGTPGVLEVYIDKARNESKGIAIQLEVEFATSSIKQIGRTTKSIISQASNTSMHNAYMDDDDAYLADFILSDDE